MTCIDILNKILYIIPTANCCVRSEYMQDESSNDFQLSGYYISWHKLNIYNCPTQIEIDFVSENEANNAAKVRQKEQRDITYSNNVNIKIGLQIAQTQNSNLTLSQYLDNLGV